MTIGYGLSSNAPGTCASRRIAALVHGCHGPAVDRRWIDVLVHGCGPSVAGRLLEPLACRRPARHDRGMKSRVHPTYKDALSGGELAGARTRPRLSGDVTLGLRPDAKAAWGVSPSGRPGLSKDDHRSIISGDNAN